MHQKLLIFASKLCVAAMVTWISALSIGGLNKHSCLKSNFGCRVLFHLVPGVLFRHVNNGYIPLVMAIVTSELIDRQTLLDLQ